MVDLACGTGATLRASAPQLPPQQSWRLIDNDLGLLAKARRGTTAAQTIAPGRSISRAISNSRSTAPLDLVTASALLDLVSAEWLDRLVVEAAARRLPVYAALTYDGRVTLEPADPFDAEILAAFNLHQRTDKGFGPALGPDAAARAVERFAALGYSVVEGRSDWVSSRTIAPFRMRCFPAGPMLGPLTIAADGRCNRAMARRAPRRFGRRPLEPARRSPGYLRAPQGTR